MNTAQPTTTVNPVGPTMVSGVAERISGMILAGELRSGDRLKSDEIAHRLGVSRVPVREALRLMDGGGLIEVRPRRGAVVVTFDMDGANDLLDLVRVRRELEPWAASMAAQHCGASDLAAIDRAIAEGVAATERGDRIAAGAAHHALLQATARATGNRTLLDTLTPLHNRSAVAFALVAVEALPDGWTAHRLVRDAIERSDGRSARRLTRQHLDDVISALRRLPTPWRQEELGARSDSEIEFGVEL